MEEKLVVIGRYENAEMAHIDRIALAEAGIQAILENENLANVSLYHVISRCEVRLLVHREDAVKAKRILEEVQNAESIDNENDNPDSN